MVTEDHIFICRLEWCNKRGTVEEAFLYIDKKGVTHYFCSLEHRKIYEKDDD